MGRRGWAAWSVDAAAAGAAGGVLVIVGARPFGEAVPTAATAALICTWAATGSAVLAVAAATAGHHPPRMTGAGVVSLALVAPGLGFVGTAPAAARITVIAAGAALPLAAAGFMSGVLGARSRPAVGALALATVVAVTAHLLVRDPFQELRCAPYCGANPLLIVARPDWVQATDRFLALVALAWSAVSLIVLVRSGSPVSARTSAALAIATVAASGATLSWRGLTTWSEPTARVATVIPLLLIPAFLVATLTDVQLWRTRRQVHRMATDLAQGVHPGAVAGYLQRLLHDPSIRLLFPLDHDRALDDAGQVAERDRRLAATTIERDGEAIAVVEHQPVSGGRLGAVLTPAVTIVVENQRLRAVARSELDALRTSRRRIVERADETRRRLERDLHDGAQQRLLLLGMELSRAAATSDPSHRERYLAAIRHTQGALDELRKLVHEGLPPVLDELGLLEALRSLAETAPIPVLIELDTSIERRPPLAVERVVYGLTLSMIADGEALGASKVTISLGERAGQFTATIVHDAASTVDPTDDEDRVGALGGNLLVTAGSEGVEYVASFP